MSRNKASIEGPWVPHRRDMLRSPAWQTLSLSARRVLDRIELELMDHGGHHWNGRLPVTYADCIKYGVRRNSVASALREAVALGFIAITEQGRGGNAAYRKPSQFRLTYVHSKEYPRAAQLHEPTNEWRLIKTIEDAERIAAEARKPPPVNPNGYTRQKQKATPQNDTASPPELGGGNGANPPPNSGGTAQPPKRGALSISPVSPAGGAAGRSPEGLEIDDQSSEMVTDRAVASAK